MRKTLSVIGILLIAMLAILVSCDDQKKTYTLSYDANGGTGAPEAQPAAYGAELIVADPAEMTYEKHLFAGWNTAKDGKGTAYKPGDKIKITGDVKLYALWDEAKTVTFNSNGATGKVQSITVHAGETIRIPGGDTLVFEHYDFDAWNTVADGTGDEKKAKDEFKVDEDITFYARWKNHTYSVSFDANGGTGSLQALSAFYGNVVTIPANDFTRADHTPVGWNTKADGSGTAVAAGSFTVTGETTLYAQWKYGKAITSAAEIDFENGGSYWLLSDMALTEDKTIEKSLDIDLNGHELSSTGTITVKPGTAANFENGDLELVGFVVSTGDATSDQAILTLNGVDYNATGTTAIQVFGNGSLVALEDSNVTGTGNYGLKINVSEARCAAVRMNEASISIENAGGDSTALLLAAPDSNVTAFNCSFSADRQAAVIRSGGIMADGSSFSTTGAYDGTLYADTAWGSGNEAPEAVIVIGDDNGLVTSIYSNAGKQMQATLKDCTFASTGDGESLVWIESNQEESLAVTITGEAFDSSKLCVYGGLVTVNGVSPAVGVWRGTSFGATVRFTVNADNTGVLNIEDESLSSTMNMTNLTDNGHGRLSYGYSETSSGTATFTYNAGGDTLVIDSFDAVADTYSRAHAAGTKAGEWTHGTTKLTLVKTGEDEVSEFFTFDYDGDSGPKMSGNATIDGTDIVYAFSGNEGYNRYILKNNVMILDGVELPKQ